MGEGEGETQPPICSTPKETEGSRNGALTSWPSRVSGDWTRAPQSPRRGSAERPGRPARRVGRHSHVLPECQGETGPRTLPPLRLAPSFPLNTLLSRPGPDTQRGWGVRLPVWPRLLESLWREETRVASSPRREGAAPLQGPGKVLLTGSPRLQEFFGA